MNRTHATPPDSPGDGRERTVVDDCRKTARDITSVWRGRRVCMLTLTRYAAGQSITTDSTDDTRERDLRKKSRLAIQSSCIM
jgi:hypothetical protein